MTHIIVPVVNVPRDTAFMEAIQLHDTHLELGLPYIDPADGWTLDEPVAVIDSDGVEWDGYVTEVKDFTIKVMFS